MVSKYGRKTCIFFFNYFYDNDITVFCMVGSDYVFATR